MMCCARMYCGCNSLHYCIRNFAKLVALSQREIRRELNVYFKDFSLFWRPKDKFKFISMTLILQKQQEKLKQSKVWQHWVRKGNQQGSTNWRRSWCSGSGPSFIHKVNLFQGYQIQIHARVNFYKISIFPHNVCVCVGGCCKGMRRKL